MTRSMRSILVLFAVMLAPNMALADLNRGIEAFRQGKYSAAFSDLQPPAKAGNPEAQFYLGEMYLRGNGVRQDFGAAKGWYQRAAESGLPEAQAALAGLNLLGLGTKRDLESGYYWTIISVIWDQGEIRRSAMRSLSSVSGMLDAQDKASIARDAVTAWRSR